MIEQYNFPTTLFCINIPTANPFESVTIKCRAMTLLCVLYDLTKILSVLNKEIHQLYYFNSFDIWIEAIKFKMLQSLLLCFVLCRQSKGIIIVSHNNTWKVNRFKSEIHF